MINQKINADNEYVTINMNLNDINILTILLLEFIKKEDISHISHLLQEYHNFQTNLFKSNNKEEIKSKINKIISVLNNVKESFKNNSHLYSLFNLVISVWDKFQQS